MLIEQDEVVARLKLLANQVGFLSFLLFDGETTSVAQLGNDVELEGKVMTKAAGIVVDEGLYVAVCGASDDEED